MVQVPALLAAQESHGATPAHFAAANGHEGILNIIAERDPSALMINDNNGDSPAHDAVVFFQASVPPQNSCPRYHWRSEGGKPELQKATWKSHERMSDIDFSFLKQAQRII
eukprot:131408-Hanusia_phi.AAC.1